VLPLAPMSTAVAEINGFNLRDEHRAVAKAEKSRGACGISTFTKHRNRGL
jgi:hypothetical protein